MFKSFMFVYFMTITDVRDVLLLNSDPDASEFFDHFYFLLLGQLVNIFVSSVYLNFPLIYTCPFIQYTFLFPQNTQTFFGNDGNISIDDMLLWQ